MMERVRVLVVDDSALMRKLIPLILERDPDVEVVGTAMDGAFALRKIAELRPDVVTLDLEMPRMDGIETLRMIMRSAPLPVIVFSTHSKEGAYSTFKALALGAIDFVAKPKMRPPDISKPSPPSSSKKSKSPNAPAGPGKFPAQGSTCLCQQKARPPRRSAKSGYRYWNFHWRPERLAVFADSNSPSIFRRPLSLFNTCLRVLPKCLHAVWMNAARWMCRKPSPAISWLLGAFLFVPAIGI